MNNTGLFGSYGLYDWWINSFSEEERDRFKELYKPMGISYDDLVKGSLHFPQTIVGFLTMLAGFTRNKSDVSIALKFLHKAEEFIDRATTIDKHFLYQELIQSHYKLRENINHLELAKAYCYKQIAIATDVAKQFLKEYDAPLPAHGGFYQLSIILDKEKKFEEAIKICKEAKRQNWSGDWEKRITNLENKLRIS
jgi:tetratricopeptide (TPR) repeat protein